MKWSFPFPDITFTNFSYNYAACMSDLPVKNQVIADADWIAGANIVVLTGVVPSTGTVCGSLYLPLRFALSPFPLDENLSPGRLLLSCSGVLTTNILRHDHHHSSHADKRRKLFYQRERKRRERLRSLPCRRRFCVARSVGVNAEKIENTAAAWWQTVRGSSALQPAGATYSSRMWCLKSRF